LTGLKAGIACDTFTTIKGQLYYTFLTLGIMAPDTVQGASLKKNNRTDTGTIIKGISFDI
jgi:hypothetical protein